MAHEPITIGKVSIYEGKYITLNEPSAVAYGHLLPKSQLNIQMEGYLLMGCKFPDASRNEPFSDQCISTISNIGLQAFIEKANTDIAIKLTPKPIEIQIQYGYVDGTIVLPANKTAEINGKYFPIINYPSTTQNIAPGAYQAQYYYLDQSSGVKKLYAIKHTGNDATTSKRIYTIVEDLTSKIPEDVLSVLSNTDMQYTREAVLAASEFAGSDLNSFINTDQVLTASRQLSYSISVYAAILWPSATGTEYATSHNHKLIADGFAIYSNNSIYTKSANIKTWITSTLTTAQTIAVNEKKGIFANVFWQDKQASAIQFPMKLSFTSLSTYMACPYRYWHTAYNKPMHNTSSDKINEILGTSENGANYFGTIIHRNGEDLVINKVLHMRGELAHKPDATAYATEAAKHLLGINLEGIPDYDFTKEDLLRVPRNKIQEYIKEATTNIFNNIDSRTYYQDADTAITEVSINGQSIIVNGTRINISGSIDLVLLDTVHSKMILTDLKSNKEKFKYNSVNDYDKKVIQVVWYLYFLQLLQTVKVGDRIVDIPQDLDNANIITNFDFVRNPTNSLVEVPAIDRPKIWESIMNSMKSLVDSVNTYEENTAVDPASIFKPKLTDECAYCSIVSICPKKQYEDNKAFVARNELLHASKISTGLSVRLGNKAANRLSTEDGIINDNLDGLAELAVGSKEYIPELSLIAQQQLELRKAKVMDIDKAYPTQIGAVYITSPITNISMLDTKRHETYNTLRSPMPTVFRVEGTSKVASITIRFNNATKINTEMRHIIAQYVAFPYVSIRNPDITRTFLPLDINYDLYYMAGGTIRATLQKYINSKTGTGRDRYDPNKETSADFKQNIYNEMRLFFGISNLVIESVPDAVDTIDLSMNIQLYDVFTTTSDGRIAYLIDTMSVLMQLAWQYNATAPAKSKMATKMINIYSEPPSIDASAITPNKVMIDYHSTDNKLVINTTTNSARLGFGWNMRTRDIRTGPAYTSSIYRICDGLYGSLQSLSNMSPNEDLNLHYAVLNRIPTDNVIITATTYEGMSSPLLTELQNNDYIITVNYRHQLVDGKSIYVDVPIIPLVCTKLTDISQIRSDRTIVYTNHPWKTGTRYKEINYPVRGPLPLTVSYRKTIDEQLQGTTYTNANLFMISAELYEVTPIFMDNDKNNVEGSPILWSGFPNADKKQHYTMGLPYNLSADIWGGAFSNGSYTILYNEQYDLDWKVTASKVTPYLKNKDGKLVPQRLPNIVFHEVVLKYTKDFRATISSHLHRWVSGIGTWKVINGKLQETEQFDIEKSSNKSISILIATIIINDNDSLKFVSIPLPNYSRNGNIAYTMDNDAINVLKQQLNTIKNIDQELLLVTIPTKSELTYG